MHDIRLIFYTIGCALLGLAGLMLIPACIELFFPTHDYECFLFSAGITGFVGGALFFGQSSAIEKIKQQKHIYMITTLTWLVMCTFAALPFVFSHSGVSFTDAFFESVSGLTTTGSTIFMGVGRLSSGILFWRAFLQWLGGVGIIVLAVAIFPFLRIGGMQLFKTESSESSKALPRPKQIAMTTLEVYSILTVLCCLGFKLSGMDIFHSLLCAMATISTGGFSPFDNSFTAFSNNPVALWNCTVFMLIGSTPILLYYSLSQSNWRTFFKDAQTRTFFLYAALVIAALTGYYMAHNPKADFFPALSNVAFNISSDLSTTGFVSTDYSSWGPFSTLLFLLVPIIGGCTGSTAGGIKIFRFQVLFMNMKIQIQRMLFPRAVQKMHYAGHTLNDEIMASVINFALLYISTILFMAILMTLTGLDIMTSFSSVVGNITNTSLGFGPYAGPTGSYALLNDTPKWILSFTMLLGRLEVMTAFILFTPMYWRA